MRSTSVTSHYFRGVLGGLGKKAFEVSAVPCVVKSISFGAYSTTTPVLETLNILEMFNGGTISTEVLTGGSSYATVLGGRWKEGGVTDPAGNSTVKVEFPGMGIRFDTSCNIEVSIGSAIGHITIIMQSVG